MPVQYQVRPYLNFARYAERARRGSVFAGDGDLESSADLTHPLVTESAEALYEGSKRHALYRVEVHDRPPRDRVLARLEQDFAREPTDCGRTRPDQRTPKPRNRRVSGQHDDGSPPDLGELTPPDLSAGRKCVHDAPAAFRNDARSPHSSLVSSGELSYAA